MRGSVSFGFTLIELLVVIGVIALVTIIAIPNIQNIRNEQNLSAAVSELQSKIRIAQNNATSGVKCTQTGQPPASWYFATDATNPTTKYVIAGAGCSNQIITTDLSAFGVVMDKINDCSPTSGFGVSFANISGAVSFTSPSGCTNSTSMMIQLRTNSGSCPINCKSAVIDSAGKVYVQ